MKKRFSLFIVALFAFATNSFAHETYFIFDTIYNCNKPFAVKIWMDEHADTLGIDSFEVMSFSGRIKHNILDTAFVKLTCDLNFIQVQAYTKIGFVFDRISLIKPCEQVPISAINKGFIDSASQTSKIELICNDSNANNTWNRFLIRKITEVDGKMVNEPMDSFALFETDGILNTSFNLNYNTGKYLCEFIGQDENSCEIIAIRDFWIGNLCNARVDSQGFVIDSVYYWHPAGNQFCQLTNWWDNQSCIDTNAFFTMPDSNSRRAYWLQNNNYTAPKIKEAIYYDYGSNGTIDDSAKSHRIYVDLWRSSKSKYYTQIPESFNNGKLTVWSRDSVGQWICNNIVYDQPTSLLGADVPDFEIYPNPATDVLLINSTGTTNSFVILDFAGRTMLTGNLHLGENVIRIDDFEMGAYFIHFKTNNNSVNRIFIKN